MAQDGEGWRGHFLRGIDIFRGLTARQLDALAALGQRQVFPPGGVLVRAGDQADELYAILRGEVHLLPPPANEVVDTLSAGESGPLVVLVESPVCSVTLIAATEVEAFVIPRAPLMGLLRQQPALGRRLSQAALPVLTKRYRALSHELAGAIQGEAEFRGLLQLAPDAVLVVNDDRRIVRVNPSAETMFGYGHGELVGKPLDTLVPERFREEHVQRCAEYRSAPFVRAMGTGVQKYGKRKDGSEFSVDIMLSPWEVEEGHRVIAVARDVTERTRAQASLEAAEARFRTLVEKSLVGIYIIQDGRFLYVNPKFAELSGYTQEEITSSPSWEFLAVEEDRPLVAENVRKRLEGEVQSLHYTFRWRRKDGAVLTIEALGSMTEINGRPAIIGTVVDITERKRAEQELRKANRALRALSEATMAQVHATEEPALLNDVCRIIVEAGGYRLAWIGFAEEGEGKPVRAVARWGDDGEYVDTAAITWADAEKGRGPTGTAIRTGKPAVARNLTGDPSYEPWRTEATRRGYASSAAFPLLDQGRAFGALNVYAAEPDAFDLAEVELLSQLADDLAYGILALRTRAEGQRAERALEESNRRLEAALAQLRAVQRQVVRQERLRALGQMASGIAHDFNNLLTPILGYSELLLGHPESLADRETATRYLKTISMAAQDAATVVSRLREFYREPEEGENFTPVNLENLVGHAVSLTQARWKDQALAEGVRITIEAHVQGLPLIMGNEGALRQALANLILNAVDAMPKGGTISFTGRSEGDQVVLEVKDTGTGMTEEVRERCFEPFFTTKGERGTGLGLSIVYGIVQRHTGSIEVASEAGKGTTFTIRLPVRRDRKAGAAQGKGKPYVLHVLVVDDEPRVRQLVADYLAADGFTVEAATNGREALKKFEAGKFDLVITDRAMPELSGDQLAEAIKRIAPHLPVILLTGFGDTLKDAGEKPAGVDAVVSKPPTVVELREALAKVIEGRSWG